MARIRVNPAILNQSAGGISTTANQVHKIGDDVWRNASGAPSYDGQFGPKLRSIGQSAMAQAQRHSSRMSGLSGSLSKRASAFLAADAMAVKGVQIKTILEITKDLAYLGLLARIMEMSISQIMRLILLGKIRLPIGKISWSLVNPKPIPTPNPGPTKPNKPTIVVRNPPEKIKPEKVKNTQKTQKWPVPPTKPKLNNVSAKNYKSCALYAAARRPDLGSTQSNREKFKDQAAANYICKFQEKAFQVTKKNGDLREIIGKGYALVWEPGVGGSNKEYGHVAIVEEVGADYVIVSHSGWTGETRTKISINKLSELWLIP